MGVSEFEALTDHPYDAKAYQDITSYTDRGLDGRDALISHNQESLEALKAVRGVDTHLSGITPTQKAVNYAKFIKNYLDPNGGNLGEAIESLEKAREALKEGKIPGGLKGGKGEGDPIDAEELELDDIDLEWINYLNLFENMPTFKVGGKKKKVQSPKGKNRMVRMTDYSDLASVDPSEFMDPTFKLKLVGKQFRVAQKYKYIIQKQQIYMMIDDSGSMHGMFSYVKAVLAAVRPGILKGETELYLCRFLEECHKFKKITDIESFDKMFAKFPAGSGGGTEVGDCVKEVADMISKGMWGKHPINDIGASVEIVIVNDGQDHVSGVPEITTHALMFQHYEGLKNEGLQEFCLKSGGTFNYVKA
jgi:hypothetical protein